MSTENSLIIIFRVVAAAIVVLALIFVPSPLLPPHRFAEAVQSILGVGWKVAYLVAAVGLQVVFFGSIGVVSAFAVKRASTPRRRFVQILFVPILIAFVALTIRFVKMGYLPVWINAAIPVAACLLGVWLGLGLLYRSGKIALLILAVVTGAAFWLLSGGPTAELSRITETHLRKLVASSSDIPAGEARFGALMKVAFTPLEGSEKINAVENNRAAILALGIALGDERLAKLVGLNRDNKLMREAASLRKGTTLRKRGDWPRHFFLSAGLTVLENSLVSDAGGLMKEQLDALTRGSGFSFCDVAADRAGVRFATAATNSEEDAKAMQEFMMRKFNVSDFFPIISDLPENLTPEQFQKEYGSVGSQLYREKIADIETRLDRCVALSPLYSGTHSD